MKTITETGQLTDYSTNVIFAILTDGILHFKSIKIHILVENSFDYKVNQQIPLEYWIKSMLHEKIIVPVDFELILPEKWSILKVENVDIDYILLTLLLILQKLNKDESVIFKCIQYEEI